MTANPPISLVPKMDVMHILHFEDNPADALLVESELEAAGLSVHLTQVERLADGLDRLRREKYDLLLLDLNLPDSDGPKTYDYVREVAPHLPIVVLTGIYDEAGARNILRKGAQDYLVKGRAVEHTLAQAVNFAIERQFYATQLARKTRQLEASEARIRKIIEASADAMIVVDVEGLVRFANPSAETLFGRKKADVVAHPFGFPMVNGQSSEVDIVRRDGTRAIAEMRVVETEWDGQPAYLATLRDITKRKHTETSLSLFRSLVDNSNDAFEVVDPRTGRFLDVNDKGCRDLGYSRDELLELNVSDVDDTVKAENWPSIAAEVLENRTKMVVGRHRRKDGSTYPVEVNVKRVTHNGDYLVAVVRDITERQRTEERMRRDADILSHLRDAVIFTDLDAKVVYWSEAATRLFGWNAGEMAGKPYVNRFPEAERAEVQRRLAMIREGHDFHHEREDFRKDGSRVWVEMRAYQIKDDAGAPTGFLCVFNDITGRRKLEEQLRQAQKLDAIGTLAGGIAHDFNNILMAMNGYTNMAKMVSTEKQVAEYLDTALKAGDRAAILVRQILAFSRKEPEERHLIQLHLVVQETLGLLRATLPASIEISSKLDKQAPTVLANAGQVQQVLLNLGTNAAHAMRDRPGRLEFKLEQFAVDENLAAQHPRLQPGPYVRISVSDNGHGMDKATVQRIFEPFFTTKPVGEGTGLGLAVTHGIMQSHEGAITVYSQPGEGTTFHLYFPVFEGKASLTEAEAGEIPQGHGEQILFVDDELPLMQLGKKTLEMLGYKVDAFASPTEALALLEANPARYDLLITDQSMPGMTGMELARQAQMIRAGLRIILTTGYSGKLSLEIAQAGGVCALLPKPNTIHMLGTLVHRVLHES